MFTHSASPLSQRVFCLYARHCLNDVTVLCIKAQTWLRTLQKPKANYSQGPLLFEAPHYPFNIATMRQEKS